MQAASCGLLHRLSQFAAVPDLRFGVCGPDWLFSALLEPYVHVMAAERRGWERFRVFYVPIGEKPSDVRIAQWIASQDANYK